MPIPNYQAFMLPLLEIAADGKPHAMRDAVAELASYFSLSHEEITARLPSGSQTVVYNRVGWARTYLRKAGLLDIPVRAHFSITERGRAVLADKLDELNVQSLLRFDEFREFKGRSSASAEPVPQDTESTTTPEEAIEYGYQQLNNDLLGEILSAMKACSPSFFERLVIDLLVKMGYGGSRREAGEVLGKSGDAGIDGIIKEDRLGLETIYVQAKRWEAVVGRPEIQKFAGALLGQKAHKGIFLTTSSYSGEAKDYAANLDSKVILVDGQQLAALMLDAGLGVATVATYEVKKLDSDYFLSDE